MKQNKGFTVVELAVVIIVIALLAAVAIVSYGNWRTSVATNEVQNDLHGVASAMESARQWNEDGSLPTYADNTVFSTASGTDAVFDNSDSVTLTYKWGSTTTYCIEGVSIPRTSVVYNVRFTGGNKTLASGTCPAES